MTVPPSPGWRLLRASVSRYTRVTPQGPYCPEGTPFSSPSFPARQQQHLQHSSVSFSISVQHTPAPLSACGKKRKRPNLQSCPASGRLSFAFISSPIVQIICSLHSTRSSACKVSFARLKPGSGHEAQEAHMQCAQKLKA